jgi:hypothetical protein
MRLKTNTGEVHFNTQTISHVHLGPDRSMVTVHFVNDTRFGLSMETDDERTVAADLLAKLADEQSGFLPVGNELLNLRSALWILIPDEGPIQVRSADNRTHSLPDVTVERIRQILGE